MFFLLKDVRALLFFTALIIYGAFGSPTPDQLGWVEAGVACLLIISLNFSVLKNFFLQNILFAERWKIAALVLMVYGLIAPTIMAFVTVPHTHEMLRDLVAFFFILLPFFLLPFLNHHAARQRAFIYGALGIAFLFILRTIWLHYFQEPSADFKLLYLANSPLILWAVLFCTIKGGQDFMQKRGLKALLIALFLIILLGVALASMAADTQRAFLIATAITVSITMVHIFMRSPIKALMILAALGCFLALFPTVLGQLSEMVIGKTQLVGFNRRFEEWQAVWDVISADLATLCFGIGWGNGFASPAVAEIYVTYTHSLLSFILLKTGVIGFILAVAYVATIFDAVIKIYIQNGYRALAYFWPFIIPIFFYASYKSFDFGLLLTLILMTATYKNYSTKKP